MCFASKTLEDDIAQCNITNAPTITTTIKEDLYFINSIVNIVFSAADI